MAQEGPDRMDADIERCLEDAWREQARLETADVVVQEGPGSKYAESDGQEDVGELLKVDMALHKAGGEVW